MSRVVAPPAHRVIDVSSDTDAEGWDLLDTEDHPLPRWATIFAAVRDRGPLVFRYRRIADGTEGFEELFLWDIKLDGNVLGGVNSDRTRRVTMLLGVNGIPVSIQFRPNLA